MAPYNKEKGYTMTPWESDKKHARELLLAMNANKSLPLTPDSKEWLEGVISGCSNEERVELRVGLEHGPRNLWFNYKTQEWID